MPKLCLLQRFKNVCMLLYFHICSIFRPKRCKRAFHITESMPAVSDGKGIHFEESPRAHNNDVYVSGYDQASGDRGRLWCKSVASAFNNTAHSITPRKLGVDYIKIYHKSGLKIFAPKDKYIPLHFFTHENVEQNK